LHLFEVGNRLLEDVPQNLHVDELRRVVVIVGGGSSRVELVLGKFLEPVAHVIRHREGIEGGVRLEQLAVELVDVELRVPLVHPAEQRLEVVPHRARVVRVFVFVGLLDGIAGQEFAVLREGDEQDAVEQLLRGVSPRWTRANPS